MLEKKVKRSVEALPFTAEGYNRAKSILQDRFGKESEIVKSFVKEIMGIPHIPTANLRKVHDFHEKLNCSVQALQTLNKLSTVDGTVAMTMDKLPAIRGDLVRNDPHWEDWNLAQLTEALRLWTRRNPVGDAKSTDGSQGRDGKPARLYQTQQ